MESNVMVGKMPQAGNQSTFDRGAAITRSLLGYGVLVGPFYLAVGLIQAFVRDGFDLARHPLSVLANGPGGWVQTANFVLSALMVIAAAAGIARIPAPKSRVLPWFLGAFGASMLVAAVFRADPVDGFPVGTPVGPPTSISTSGMIHFIAGALGVFSLGVSALVSARMMSRRGVPSLAGFSIFAGVAVLLGFFGAPMLGSIGAMIGGIWFAVVVGWAWLAILSRHLYRAAPDPNCTR